MSLDVSLYCSEYYWDKWWSKIMLPARKPADYSIERLRPKQAEALKEPGMYHDGGGLYLRIGPTGGKSWVFRYMHAGKRHEQGLGPYGAKHPYITLAEARERAR